MVAYRQHVRVVSAFVSSNSALFSSAAWLGSREHHINAIYKKKSRTFGSGGHMIIIKYKQKQFINWTVWGENYYVEKLLCL